MHFLKFCRKKNYGNPPSGVKDGNKLSAWGASLQFLFPFTCFIYCNFNQKNFFIIEHKREKHLTWEQHWAVQLYSVDDMFQVWGLLPLVGSTTAIFFIIK